MPDPTLILLVVALGAFIVFQIFQGRKRKRETEDRQSKFVVGAEIMTNYGLYGTILSIDEDRSLVEIESTPGVVLKIHRQTILKIADYEDAAAAKALEAQGIDGDEVVPDDASALDGTGTADGASALDGTGARSEELDEPEFGERVDPARAKRKGDTPSKPSGTAAPKADD